MNGELHYWQHRWRHRVIWATLYTLGFLALVAVMYWAASMFRTHTLPVGNINIDVSHSKYVVGEPVVFSVQNKLNTLIYIANRCPNEPLDVFKLENGRWKQIHDYTSVQTCPEKERRVSVPANGSVTGNFNEWPGLFSSPGSYRLVAVVDNYNSLPYVDFEVVAKATSTPAPQTTPTVTTPSLTPQRERQQVRNYEPENESGEID